MKDEAAALWVEVFGEPPGADVDPRQMLSMLLERLEPKSYTRLSQASRARNLTFPD
jgi:hypothetical protein